MASAEVPPSLWSGFYKKPLRERQNQLRLMFPSLFRTAPTTLTPSAALTTAQATARAAAAAAEATRETKDAATTDAPRDHERVSAAAAAERAEANTATSPTRRRRSSAAVAVDTAAPTTPAAAAATTATGAPFPIAGLDDAVADHMIENCIGTVGLPVGLALNLVMNGEPLIVPMAVEEPSVVAAVSHAAKTVASAGGFAAVHAERNIMIAQIQVLDVLDLVTAAMQLTSHTAELVALGNRFCESMVARGGGVQDITVRTVTPRAPRQGGATALRGATALGPPATKRAAYLAVHVLVDVCEAMGANVVNAVAEGMADRVAEISGGRIGLRILSNLAVHRTARVRGAGPGHGVPPKQPERRRRWPLIAGRPALAARAACSRSPRRASESRPATWPTRASRARKWWPPLWRPTTLRTTIHSGPPPPTR